MNLQVVQEIFNIAFEVGKFSLIGFIIGMLIVSITAILAVADSGLIRIPATILLCIVNIINYVVLFIFKLSLITGIISWLILHFA